jgi:hypothetical protein
VERLVTGAVRTWRFGFVAGVVGAAPPAVVGEVGVEEVSSEAVPPAVLASADDAMRADDTVKPSKEIQNSAALIARTRKTTSFVGLRG